MKIVSISAREVGDPNSIDLYELIAEGENYFNGELVKTIGAFDTNIKVLKYLQTLFFVNLTFEIFVY